MSDQRTRRAVVQSAAVAPLVFGLELSSLFDTDEGDVVPVAVGTKADRTTVDSAEVEMYLALSGHRYEPDGDGGWTLIETPRNTVTDIDVLPSYAASDLPSAPADGTEAFDSTRQTVAWYAGDWERPNFVDDVLTSPTTVSNTTTKTQVWEPTIDDGSLVAGRTYQIDLMGKFSTANTSDTFDVSIDLAGTSLAGVTNQGANVSDAPWSVEFTYTVREDGESGTIQPHTKGLFNSNPADAHHSTMSVDTTTATTISVHIEWSAADTANSATLGQAHLKQMA